MMGASVGIEAGPWPGQLTEQPRVDEQPEVAIDGAQAHPWRSADDQAVNFLGSGVRLDVPDDLEHRVARSGQPEPPVPQRDLGTLDTRRPRIVRHLSDSPFRSDSHFQQLSPGCKSPYGGSRSVSRSGARRSRRSAPRAPGTCEASKTRSSGPSPVTQSEAGAQQAALPTRAPCRPRWLRVIVRAVGPPGVAGCPGRGRNVLRTSDVPPTRGGGRSTRISSAWPSASGMWKVAPASGQP